MVFKTKGPQVIYLPRAGARVRFDQDGEYNTDDPREISALKKSRHVELVDDSFTGGLIQSKDRPSAVAQVQRQEDRQQENEQFAVTSPASPEEEKPREKIKAENYTRDELEALAKRVGVEDPEKMANKESIAAAINRSDNHHV